MEYKITRFKENFDYNLEWGIRVAFVWNIPNLLIRYTYEFTEEKQVLSPQDFSNGHTKECVRFILVLWTPYVVTKFFWGVLVVEALKTVKTAKKLKNFEKGNPKIFSSRRPFFQKVLGKFLARLRCAKKGFPNFSSAAAGYFRCGGNL